MSRIRVLNPVTVWGSCLLTVLEFLASFMRFSATFMSSWTELVSVNRREFRWSCTFTHIISTIYKRAQKGQWSVSKNNSATGLRILCASLCLPVVLWWWLFPAAACTPAPAGISVSHGSSAGTAPSATQNNTLNTTQWRLYSALYKASQIYIKPYVFGFFLKEAQ